MASKKVPVPCIFCGALFTQKRSERKHCYSNKCESERKNKNRRAVYHRAKRKVNGGAGKTATCVWCDKEFPIPFGTGRKARYCGERCRAARGSHKTKLYREKCKREAAHKSDNPTPPVEAKRRVYSLETLRWGVLLDWWLQRHSDTVYAVPDTTMESIEKAKEQS